MSLIIISWPRMYCAKPCLLENIPCGTRIDIAKPVASKKKETLLTQCIIAIYMMSITRLIVHYYIIIQKVLFDDCTLEHKDNKIASYHRWNMFPFTVSAFAKTVKNDQALSTQILFRQLLYDRRTYSN